MNISPETQQLTSIARILQSKSGQSLIQRATEVMAQLKTVQSTAKPTTPPVQSSEENWAMTQLIELSKILGLPADKTLGNLVPFATALMANRK